MDKSHLQVLQGWRAGRENMFWIVGSLGFIITQCSGNEEGILTRQNFFSFYTPQQHTHTHTTQHAQHTHSSNKASDPKAGHRDSQPNLFLRKGRKTLLLQAALLQNCSLMPQGLCTISSLHTDQRLLFLQDTAFYCHNKQYQPARQTDTRSFHLDEMRF